MFGQNYVCSRKTAQVLSSLSLAHIFPVRGAQWSIKKKNNKKFLPSLNMLPLWSQPCILYTCIWHICSISELLQWQQYMFGSVSIWNVDKTCKNRCCKGTYEVKQCSWTRRIPQNTIYRFIIHFIHLFILLYLKTTSFFLLLTHIAHTEWQLVVLCCVCYVAKCCLTPSKYCCQMATHNPCQFDVFSLKEKTINIKHLVSLNTFFFLLKKQWLRCSSGN